MTDCPICQLPLKREPDLGIYDCQRCGHFELGYTGETARLRDILADEGPQRRRRANLSRIVCRRTRPSERHVFVPLADLDRWGLDQPLPSPTALLDELVLWIGENAASYNQAVPANGLWLSGWLGLPLDHRDRPGNEFSWLVNTPEVARVVQIPDRSGPLALKLSWEGWERYETLKRREASSFAAFMAMKFGDAVIDDAVDNHFKPAVAATGFTLRRVIDGQGAGLIDDQMRVGLRTSRFVVADLTHASRGAYWEAGFAEGLGKPVIYTCRKDHWIEEQTHFDTNHLVTIVWDPSDLAAAAAALKATIRATLPDVAKMAD